LYATDEDSVTFGSLGSDKPDWLRPAKQFAFRLFHDWTWFQSYRSFPKVTVKGQTLIYTNNYRKRIHYRTKLKAGASDSIEQIINLITDTAVKRFNPCIHSGAVCRLDVAGKAKTVHFTLKNTFDSSAYKIITILNNNLPSKYKLGIPVNWWQNEQPCYEELLREANSLNVKQGGVQQ
jgi:hypothetical protein